MSRPSRDVSLSSVYLSPIKANEELDCSNEIACKH